jgi:hypothetical protein
VILLFTRPQHTDVALSVDSTYWQEILGMLIPVTDVVFRNREQIVLGSFTILVSSFVLVF